MVWQVACWCGYAGDVYYDSDYGVDTCPVCDRVVTVVPAGESVPGPTPLVPWARKAVTEVAEEPRR